MRPQASLRHAVVIAGAAALVAAAVLFVSGCESRMSTGTYAPDSTLVYGSRRASDINATITFALKGSKKAEEARKAEIEAKRKAEEERKAAIAAKKKAEAERKAAEAKKAAAKKKSGAKKGSKKKAAGGDANASGEPGKGKNAALPDAKAGKAAVKAAPDSLTAEAEKDEPDTTRVVTKKTKAKKLVEDRAFEIEEGARVQATITLTNRMARGERPLLMHLVWVRPGGIRTYKKLIEFDPTGTDSTFTGAMTISPDKRAPGPYILRVYLFRELIAEKAFMLTGTGMEEKETGEGQM